MRLPTEGSDARRADLYLRSVSLVALSRQLPVSFAGKPNCSADTEKMFIKPLGDEFTGFICDARAL